MFLIFHLVSCLLYVLLIDVTIQLFNAAKEGKLDRKELFVATMPPDNSEDYDVHLERSLRELQNLRDEFTYDIVMLYSADNLPKSAGDAAISPKQVCDDLRGRGFKV